mgnify:CR=1 FL=1
MVFVYVYLSTTRRLPLRRERYDDETFDAQYHLSNRIDVCDFINANYKHVRDVALVGGEPLLLPENERLLDVIPDDCNVTIITNMNVDLEKNKTVIGSITQGRGDSAQWTTTYKVSVSTDNITYLYIKFLVKCV